MTNFNKHPTQKIGFVMLVIGWILIIAIVWILYSEVIFAPRQSEVKIKNGVTEIKLYPQLDGHYRILGHINQNKVKFLIDTGATQVAIPLYLAEKLKLPKLGSTMVSTAGGRSKAYTTNIDKLEIGNVVISNIKALIIEDMDGDTSLLGMNVLRKFEIKQNKDFLILEIPNTYN